MISNAMQGLIFSWWTWGSTECKKRWQQRKCAPFFKSAPVLGVALNAIWKLQKLANTTIAPTVRVPTELQQYAFALRFQQRLITKEYNNCVLLSKLSSCEIPPLTGNKSMTISNLTPWHRESQKGHDSIGAVQNVPMLHSICKAWQFCWWNVNVGQSTAAWKQTVGYWATTHKTK